MSWQTELAYDRAREEAFQEILAQAHIDNYEVQCDECGAWVDEDGVAVYQDQNLCHDCHRAYVFADFEKLAEEIQIAFSRETGGKAKELLASMRGEA
jgi:hypothetical protein